MPWFPDFAAAAELARRELRARDQADPVARYLDALSEGDARSLEASWPGEVVVFDPRAGEVRGHRHLRRFIKDNRALWAGRDVTTEIVGSTSAGRRAVVELLVHLGPDHGDMVWPIAVVAESSDEASVAFRTYCSQVPVDGHRHLRPPILTPSQARPGDVVGRWLAALDAGDTDAIVETFESDGSFSDAIGSDRVHRGTAELRTFFTGWFGAGGGIGLEGCAVTDDGVRCAVECNLLRWGSHELPPQAGLLVFERGTDGRLAAAHIYDDVDPPVDRS
jgi:ketosteroid isomerase-like protein